MIQVIFTIMLAASLSWANIAKSKSPENLDLLGGVDYWPWGKEIDLPWEAMTGIWVAEQSNGSKYYYSIKSMETDMGHSRIMRIMQFDPLTCETLGAGMGFQTGRIVQGRFFGPSGDSVFRIHVFRERDVIKNSSPLNTRPMIVISFSQIENSLQKQWQQIVKLHSNPSIHCR